MLYSKSFFSKLPVFLLFLVVAFALAACGGGDEPAANNGDDGIADATTEDEPAPTDTPVVEEEPEPTEVPTEEPEPTAVPTEPPTEEPEPTEEPVEEPTKEPVEEATSEPVEEGSGGAVVSSGEAGPACFGTSGEGLTCLTTDGEWVVYTQDNSDLYIDFISSINECNGNFVIGLSSSLALFDGQTFSDFPDREDFGSNEAAVCDEQGGVWVAHFKGVSYYDGGTWTTYDETNFGDETLMLDIDQAPNGDVWVVTSNKIASFNGSEWTLYEEGNGFDDQYFFKNLAIDPQGVVWASHGGGLLVFGDGAWREIDSGQFLTPRGLAADAAGNVLMGTFSTGLQIYDQQTWTEVTMSSEQVEAVEIDDNGRVWVGTAYGINVWDGNEWHVFRMDNANLSSNRFVGVAVIGGGPALPAPVEKAPGSMTGFFTLDGEPYADAIVEICVEELYSSFSGDTPCADQPYSQQATTDGDGVFTFTDVPVGLYSIVVQTADGWAKFSGEFNLGSEFVPIFEGETTEVGELLLTSEEE